MPGSRHRVEPEILAPNSATLFYLLRRLPHASVARKRFACQPIGRTSGPWPCGRNPSSGWVASSLHSQGCLKEATFELFSAECRDTRVFARSEKLSFPSGYSCHARIGLGPHSLPGVLRRSSPAARAFGNHTMWVRSSWPDEVFGRHRSGRVDLNHRPPGPEPQQDKI